MNPKPCPFCGEIPRLEDHTGYDSGTYISCRNPKCRISPCTYLTCGSAKYPTHKESREGVVAEWNRRASLSAETGKMLAEAVMKAIRDITTGIHQNKIGDEYVSGISCQLGAALAAYEQEKKEGV